MSRKKGGTHAVAVQPSAVPSKRPGQPGGARDRNRQERTRVLADAALALFLERGIEGVAIDDITAAAGVAKGSFYRYFADKAALVEALFAPVERQVAEALGRCEEGIAAAADRAALVAAYERVGLELGRLVFEHRHVIRLYLQERRGPDAGARVPVRRLAARLEREAERLTARARDRGLLRPFPARTSALAVVGAAEQLLFAFLSGVDLGDPTAVPAQIASLIMEGLRSRE